jgi:predicted CXXCH cytochrome family protein
MKEKMAKEKVHSPAEDCLSCHQPHFAAQLHLAAQPVGELCAQCHDTKDAKFSKAHLSIDPKNMNCVSCHSPHSSKDPKFFKAVEHAPFSGRACDACHTAK